VLLLLVGVGSATAFALLAFQENMLYYYSPSDILSGKARAAGDRSIRAGGLVVQGSVQREPGSLTVRFILTDTANTLAVRYTGILPDLFREGQGIIATGQIDAQGELLASEVLAKHDENYMPPPVQASLDAAAKAAPAPAVQP
jgi:cytochrome c-type biogenesis protein CcmE